MANSWPFEEQFIAALRRITRAMDLHSRLLLQTYGLTFPQLAALRAIGRLEPVTAAALARDIHLGRPTVTGILHRLELRGLIQRVRGDQDRRSVNISLTEAGRSVVASAPSLLDDQFQGELAGLQQWERTQILATLQRVAEMMNVGRLRTMAKLAGGLTDSGSAEVEYQYDESLEGLDEPGQTPQGDASQGESP
jgi:DNA-binding MarR family transcriptional regulator